MRGGREFERLVGLAVRLMVVVPFLTATVLAPLAFARALVLSAWDPPRAPAVLASWLSPAWSWALPAQVRAPVPPAPSDLSAVPLGRAAATAGGYRLAVEIVPARFARTDTVRVSVAVADVGTAPLPLPQVQLRATATHSAWPVWVRDVTPAGEGIGGGPSAVCSDGAECLAPGETARWAGLAHGYELGQAGEYLLRVQAGGVAAVVRYEIAAPQAVTPSHTVVSEAGPWRITLSTPRGTYARGEPVTVHVTIRNRSAQPQPLGDSMVPRVYVSLVHAGTLVAQWPIDLSAGYLFCADRPVHTEYPPKLPRRVACLPPGGRVEAEITWPGALPIGAQPEPAPRGGPQRSQHMGALDSPPGNDGWEPVPVEPGAYALMVGLGPTSRVTVRSREKMMGGFLVSTPLLWGYPGVVVMQMPVAAGYWVRQPYAVRLPITVTGR